MTVEPPGLGTQRADGAAATPRKQREAWISTPQSRGFDEVAKRVVALGRRVLVPGPGVLQRCSLDRLGPPGRAALIIQASLVVINRRLLL